MRFGLRLALWLFAGSFLPALAAAAGSQRRFEYLYVEANEGSSAGGHVAVRFDDETFHFQHESPGVLRLHRDDSLDFLFRYALLGNRSVRETRIAVSDETFDLLRQQFSRRSLIQAAQFAARDDLVADTALLALFAAPPAEGAATFVPGLGYFSIPAPTGGSSAAVASVRDCVRRRYGAGFIDERSTEIAQALRALRPLPSAYAAVALGPDDYPAFPSSFSARYQDLLAAREALSILAAAPQLDPTAYRAPAGDVFALAPGEGARLEELSRLLAAELCPLVVSPRPDWGTALAVGMARLAALEVSVERRRWVFLDPYPPGATLATVPEGPLRQPYLDAIEGESLEDFDSARKDLLAADGFHELAYGAVEAASNRYLEAGTARSGGPLRLRAGVPLPLRPARVDLVRPDWGAEEAAGYLDSASAAAGRLQQQLVQLYPYDLIRRNCVSETFTTIDSALARVPAVQSSLDRGAAIRAESRQRLGGHIDTDLNLDFIPLASEAAVSANYRVAARSEVPSYRQLRLSRLERDEPTWRVWLRESNTLTSQTYRPGPGDSTFLFFTEEPLPLRPILGVGNVVFSLGDSVVGLATLPLAGPDRLVRGLRGALYSLPELAFINLRKGTTSFVARHTDEVVTQRFD